MKVFSNTAMSADGKIATFRHDHVAIGSAEDRRLMGELRARADGVLVGGRTFRNWPLPLVEAAGSTPASRRRPILNAVLTRRGLLADGDEARVTRHWPNARASLLVLGGTDLDADAHRTAFGAEVVRAAEPTVAWAIAEMAARGCEHVLVEGGGDLLFQLLEADLLDEMYLTLCPLVIGGRAAPTPMDGPGFSADRIRHLALADVKQVGDEVFLRYLVKP